MSDQTESKESNATAVPEAIDTTDERALRRAKRQALKDAGVDPYPSKTHVTHRAAQLEAAYVGLEAGADTEDVVCIAGRVRAIRKQGKVAFVVVEDSTGSIQLFCRINVLGETGWEVLGTFDVGDIVEATGTIVRTRRGELSVSPTSLVLLTKALRPLPEKFHGLSDKETRYRQRYVDLIMNPEVKSTFVKRAKILSAIRAYMAEQGYLEMETPILQEIQGGATARPFTTHFNALNQDCYLRIATELHLKRLLVGGFERVFEIGRIFRNEGMDPTHNPEFTSMEAYCAYADTEDMKRLSEGLFKAACLAVNDSLSFTYQGVEVDLSGEWRSATMVELVSERVGEHVSIDTPLERLRAICQANGIQPDLAWGAGKLIFELYDELVEGTIIDPTFVCDYPLEVSPLAKKLPDEPRMTGRFELVIAGKEFANAFTELNDPVDQEERFAAQMAAKAAGDGEAMEYDSDFIRALEYGMPPAGGIGYGIDRLVMLLTDEPSIRDVLLFPHMRPEGKSGASAARAAETAATAAAAEAAASAESAAVAAATGTVAAAATGAVAAAVNTASAAVASVPGVDGAPATVASLADIDFSNVQVEPLYEDMIDYATFSKSDYRAVKVLACEAVPKSKKLLRFTLDDGSGEPRTILSGIHEYYEPEELVGKTCIAITNLLPRKMMGIDSCGMLISAVHHENDEERLHLLMVDPHIPAGAKLY